MRYNIIIALCCLPTLNLAQNLDLEVGIYNSFYNFVNNQPLPAQIRVEKFPTNDPMYAHEEESSSIDNRKYVSSNQIAFLPGIKIKKRGYVKRNMWGFYDGQYVYINSKNYAQTNVTRYSRILHFGRYCYFYGATDIYKKTAGTIGGLVGTLPLGHFYLLDMESGKIYKLDKTTVEEILAEYPDLHRRFQSSKQSTEHLLEFIEEYNKRY